jgi:26S proteasome non-ATPase regulatory subunit 5
MGKKSLDSQPRFAPFLRRVGQVLVCNSGDLKLRVLTCLSQLLEVKESDPNGEATTLTETWYRSLLPDNKTTSTVLSLSRQPFLDVRLGALGLLRVLCTHLWGQKELAGYSGFLEYLLDRKTEFEKTGKEAKFDMIRELVVSPFTSTSFGSEPYSRLKRLFNEGPFFVDSETAVAVEGQ